MTRDGPPASAEQSREASTAGGGRRRNSGVDRHRSPRAEQHRPPRACRRCPSGLQRPSNPAAPTPPDNAPTSRGSRRARSRLMSEATSSGRPGPRRVTQAPVVASTSPEVICTSRRIPVASTGRSASTVPAPADRLVCADHTLRHPGVRRHPPGSTRQRAGRNGERPRFPSTSERRFWPSHSRSACAASGKAADAASGIYGRPRWTTDEHVSFRDHHRPRLNTAVREDGHDELIEAPGTRRTSSARTGRPDRSAPAPGLSRSTEISLAPGCRGSVQRAACGIGRDHDGIGSAGVHEVGVLRLTDATDDARPSVQDGAPRVGIGRTRG